MTNNFNFMSLRMNFRDDPKFIHLDDVIKCIAYCFVHHLDLWVNLSQQQLNSEWGKSIFNQSSVDAGKLYNNLMLTQPFSTDGITTELSESQYESVVLTFNNSIEKQPKLSFIAKKYSDPYECMWEFCHYLFIPVRLQHDSIPKDIRMTSLRKWVNTIFTLPFIRAYTEKYNTVINNVGFIGDVLNKLLDDPIKIENFMKIEANWVFNTISRTYNKENPTQIFIRLCTNIILIASVEILKKYCPNYHQCASINPNYSGEWINPFDTKHMEHLQEINKLTALVNVSM